MKMRFLIAAALAGGIATMAAPSPALAHARYKSSTPAKGEVLAASPARVQITFTQEVQKIGGTYGIEAARAGGATATAALATLDDADRSQMSVPLLPALPAGRYVVRWKNVSDADGDPAEGAFSFYVAAQATAADLAADRDLELIGAEDDATPVATVSIAPTSAGTTPGPTVTAGVATKSGEEKGDTRRNVFIALGTIVAVAIAAVGLAVVRSRR